MNPFLPIGVMLIILGMIFIAIGFLPEKEEVKGGLLLLLGPFPVGVGDPRVLLALMILSVFLMLWWFYVVLG